MPATDALCESDWTTEETPRSDAVVAFFIRALDGGGAQRDMILLANAIAAQGRPVDILSLVTEGALKELIAPEVTIVTVPGGKIRSALPGLRRVLAQRRPAAVVSAEAASNLLTLLAVKSLPKRLRPRVILREVSSASISQRHDPYRQTRMAYALLRIAYRWADVVVTLTEGALDDLNRNFGVPRSKLVHIQSNAVIVEAEASVAAVERDRELIVSVGRLSPEKDHDTLLRAFAALASQRSVRLEIYGTGPLGPELVKLIGKLGLDDRVTLRGFVLDPFDVMRRASLVVSSSRFEGFGNVIVEALSCGTPVVATDCPYGPGEILQWGRYGQLVPVGDAEALCAAMTRALDTEPDRDALRARASPHTVERAGAALAAIIDKVLQPEHPDGPTEPGRGPGTSDRAGRVVVAAEPSPLASASQPLRCREIAEKDLDDVIRLLRRGFPDRGEAYWRRGFARHVTRTLPTDYPRYGFVLEQPEGLVGVLLTLHTRADFVQGDVVRCNLSSWYVDPRFRAYATLLDRKAQQNPTVTYLNVTPAPETFRIQEAFGSVRYCRGQMLVLPLFGRRHAGVTIREVGAGDDLSDLAPGARTLIRDHRSYGCLCFVWSDGGEGRPLILQKRDMQLWRGSPGLRVPIYSVVFVSPFEDLHRVVGSLGRLLLKRRAMPWILVDSTGPIRGLVGRFVEGRRVKFSRGPSPMPLGDLAYTELVLFGQ